MKRGTAAKVILGKNTLVDVPAGVVHGTDVILGGKAGLLNDFGGLVLSNNLMLGRKISRSRTTTVTVRGQSPLNLPDAIANSLSYVKAFGGTEQSNLPDGYIQRQFIYMLDGSYLLTDITPTYDCKVEMDFATTSVPSASITFIGGRSGDSIGNGLQLAKPSNGKFIIDAFDSTRYVSNVAPASNTRYKFTFNNQVATLESAGSTLFTNTFTGTDATGGAIAINALNTNGTITGNAAGIYLYSFKVWNAQGELVADYVPAVQKGTVPVVGFYDTVSGTFKTATAGTFAAGGEAVPTPDAPMDIVSNNGVLKVSKNLYNKYYDYERIPAYIPETGTRWAYASTGYSIRIACEPNTDYTVRYNGNSEQAVLSFGSTSSDSVPSSGSTPKTVTQAIRQNSPTIETPITLTTGASDKWLIIAFNLNDPQHSDMIEHLQLEKGSTATDYMPYGQIYTDGTVETISAHGKNLLDMADENIVVGKYISNDGTILNSSANFYNDKYIRVFGGQVYAWSASESIRYVNVSEYDSSQTFLRRTLFGTSSTAAGTSDSITLLSQTAFVRVGANIKGNTDVTRNMIRDINWQFEKGSTATDYEPYYNGGTATAEMLLKVGDYQDVQEILSGAITRNIGVKVFDGTENWLMGSTYNQFYTDNTITNRLLHQPGICSHYIYTPVNADLSTKDNAMVFGTSTQRINFSKGSFDTLASFKQFLADQYNAGTPVIVLYPLATPTTESVAGQTLQVQAGDNTLEITQASLDNLELEAQYQAAVQLTIQEVEDANLDNNVEVTIS